MSPSIEKQLSVVAWQVREKEIAKKTKVGCALLACDGKIYAGCNIEHDFCKSMHAEEVAIIKMASSNMEIRKFNYLLVVAEKENFTPCGSCMDWIIQFSNSYTLTLIGYQNKPDSEVKWYTPMELMPHYPN